MPRRRNLVEISVLKEVSEHFIGYDDFDVAEVTHFPEYQKAYRNGTSTPIDVNDYIECRRIPRKSR